MAGRRNDRAGDAGETPGLSWTRRGALAAGLAVAPAMAWAAAPGAEIPIRLAGSIPWTGVWLNGQGPFRFQIRSDTNVFHVSKPLGEQLGLELEEGEAVFGGGAQHTRLQRLFRADEMIIGGQVPLKNMRLVVADNEWQRRIHEDEREVLNPYPGVIPIPSDRITAFNWDELMMRYSPNLPADISTYGKVPLRHYENDLGWAAVVDCRFGGKPVRLTISTGSPHAITLNPDAVKRLGLWDASGPSYDRRGRFIGNEIKMRVARRGDLELGGLRIERPIVAMRDPAGTYADVYNDGQIGMELLRRANLVFDPRRDTSWLRPTAAMAEPWVHDRAGFEVDRSGPQASVDQVDAGSPAEAAGLKVGDVIATNAPNVAKLMAAQSMPAGTKIELPVLRNGQKMRIAIVNADRL